MNHELRAAAINRAIEIVSATEWSGDLRVNMNRVIGAGRVLAKAYIAEHPSDDDEPITSDWLDAHFHWHSDEESEDQYWWINPIKRVRFDVQIREPIESGKWQCVIANEMGHLEMPDLETRGDVRRLLAALGIEVAK